MKLRRRLSAMTNMTFCGRDVLVLPDWTTTMVSAGENTEYISVLSL